jgi:hypothetical protein
VGLGAPASFGHLCFNSDRALWPYDLAILESADHALFKMVRYVLLRPLRPELDAKTKTCLAEGELSSRLDEQAIGVCRQKFGGSSSVGSVEQR